MSSRAASGSVVARALRGVGWTTAATWLQLAISLATFAVATLRLGPTDIGTFGIAQLICSFAAALIGGALGDALKQRAEIEDDHIHSTFWVSTLSALMVCFGLVGWAMAAPLAHGHMAALSALSVGIPVNVAGTILGALLARDLRFGALAWTGSVSALSAGVVVIAGVFSGWGVWSLVAAELVRSVVSLALLSATRIYRPALPKRWGVFLQLVRFNLSGLGSYLIGYGDRFAPRALVGALLGPTAVGYFIVAERVLDLLGQLVLTPLASITLTAVARLQNEPQGLRQLIRHLYGLSTLLGYPAFIGAIVTVPVLAEMIGPRWEGAVVPAQILLLVGLRTTTGIFNLSVLRGVGRPMRGLILLSAGLALQLLLVPLGVASWGLTGAAVAVLVRTYATWPLGCWFVKQATGLTLTEQLFAGGAQLVASLVMATAMELWLRSLGHHDPSMRLVTSVAVGCVIYVVALLVLSSSIRNTAAVAWQGFRQAGLGEMLRRIRTQWGLQEA